LTPSVSGVSDARIAAVIDARKTGTGSPLLMLKAVVVAGGVNADR